MRPARVVALVIGCLVALPAVAMFISGGVLGAAYLSQRDDDGFFDVTLDRIESPTVAVTAEDLDFFADPGSPGWLVDALDAEFRIRVTGADTDDDIFIGIARESDLDQYLAGVAHDEVIELDDGAAPVYRTRTGRDDVGAPADETFWGVSASGQGTQEINWEPTRGRWAAVVMSADGTPGVNANVTVGARADFVLPLAALLTGLGAVLLVGSVVLIIVGARGGDDHTPPPVAPRSARPQMFVGLQEGAPSVAMSDEAPQDPIALHPVALEAELERDLSRWLWLVKWFLAIPHVIVLCLLWIAFVVLTAVAAISILFVGRYPRQIFDFNVGVLRWTWRVSFYASSGGLGSDTYPHFGLRARAGDNPRLDIEYPEKLSRPLVLVKWLLAVPHLIIVALLTGGSVRWLAFDGDRFGFDLTSGGGLLGLLALAAGIMLLFTNRYPIGLFDLTVGLNRWVYRVIAYVALMTDRYPPFWLDQGGSEPRGGPPIPAPPAPATQIDLRDEPLVPAQ